MESVTDITQKFVDEYAWTKEPELNFDTGEYETTTVIDWKFKLQFTKEALSPGPIKLQDPIGYSRTRACTALRDAIFPLGSAAVVTNGELYSLLEKCKKEADTSGDALSVVAIVEDFINKTPVF